MILADPIMLVLAFVFVCGSLFGGATVCAYNRVRRKVIYGRMFGRLDDPTEPDPLYAV